MAYTILHIDSSPRGEQSVSRKLTAQVVENLKEKNNDVTVMYKDLSHGVPFVSMDTLTGFWTPPEEHDEKTKAAVLPSDQAIQEIFDADALVIGVPMWNFHVPATVKAWVDLIARSGKTFKQGENGYEGLVPAGKKAYVVVTTGGVPVGSDYDMTSKYMQSILGFIGITDVTIIDAGQLVTVGDTQLEAAEAAVAAL